MNQNGEVKNYYQHSAFGESEVAEENYYNRLRYNSQIYDELTSQYYLRARYYQPQIGRFTQEDILYNDGLNLYAYCQNNPVMYSDPSGYAKATNGCDPKVQGENAGDKNGSNPVNDVVNHIKNKGTLPDNYITKTDAKKLGWKPQEGNLDIVAPGKSIGGDIYQNRNHALPVADGRTYFEADLNYTGGFRGHDRLIYSNDGLFYTTSDHYKTFTQIGDIN